MFGCNSWFFNKVYFVGNDTFYIDSVLVSGRKTQFVALQLQLFDHHVWQRALLDIDSVHSAAFIDEHANDRVPFGNWTDRDPFKIWNGNHRRTTIQLTWREISFR